MPENGEIRGPRSGDAVSQRVFAAGDEAGHSNPHANIDFYTDFHANIDFYTDFYANIDFYTDFHADLNPFTNTHDRAAAYQYTRHAQSDPRTQYRCH